MNKKRLTAVAAMLCVIPLVLAACGSSGSDDSSNGDSSASGDADDSGDSGDSDDAGDSDDSGDSDDAGDSGDPTEITYWQYTYDTKVALMDKLVKQFEDENPDIKVVAQDYPYDQFQNKVFASQKAGVGPDIVNVYSGWVAQFAKRGAIQKIPSDFMSTEEINDYYVDAVKPQSGEEDYYSLPIAVRSLALFWNKDLFEEAGLDPESPPQTWDELIEDAQKITKMTDDGRFEQEGFGWNADGQGYHTFEEVLLRQWGITPWSDDGREVLFNSGPEGLEAFKYWIEMKTKYNLGDPNFNDDYSTAFVSGKAGMIVDGSFRLGDLKEDIPFEWGVTELPVKEEGGVQSNFASYWTNAIATGVEGDKLEASQKFLKFLISPEVQKDWLDAIGELPAAQSLSDDQDILDNEMYAPFVKALPYAHTTFFVDEDASREAFLNVIDDVLLNDAPLDKAFEDLVDGQQKVRDEFFNE